MVEVQPDPSKTSSPAWPPGHKYGLPCKCKQAVGEKRLRYIQPDKAYSYKPHKIYRKPEEKMPDGTTYKLSYDAFDPSILGNCRGKPTIARENLVPAGDFSGMTTHKLSYGAWPGVTRQKIHYPRDHRLTGDGPMQEVTTHRHDYTPKCIDTVSRVTQPNLIGVSKAPMEDNSIMSMSYKCPDYNQFQPAISYKPETRYLAPSSPVDGDTVQKLSYMPWEPQPKPEMPWAKQGPYVKPRVPLEGNTIYNGSYLSPGRLIEDPHGHCIGCYCLYPAECFDESRQPPKADTCPLGYDPNKDPPRPPPITDHSLPPET